MRIMSFNTQHCMNYIEGRIDYGIMADAICSCGADIVGLNEMRGAGPDPEYEDQVPVLAELTGLEHWAFAEAIRVGGENPYGNGLLSRWPIESWNVIPVPDPEERYFGQYYEARCLLQARLSNGLTVMVIHFGLNPDEQENAVRTVMAHLPTERCILMGDFNVDPEDPVLLPIRKRMRDAADAFAGLRMSWPSDSPERKIDYIFVTPDITVTEADIPDIVASDHRPHTACISL